MRSLPALLLTFFCLFSGHLVAATPAQGVDNRLTILSYHEVADKADALTPAFTVTPTQFVRQLDWLRNHGYHFVSVDDVLADRAGKQALPDKPVLLTFDDGYQSVYRHVFPILKLFHAPAVVSLVGSWMEEQGSVDFDGTKIPRRELMTWDEIRTMQQSGLVEIGSHTYALHRGIPGNPQGNMEPAPTTREYHPVTQRYEDEAAYLKRIDSDLRRNSALIRARTGVMPRVIAWPYGRYNQELEELALKNGLVVGFTLDDGPNDRHVPLTGLRRLLVDNSMSLWDIDRVIAERNRGASDNDRPMKAAHIDLDYLYDKDPAQQERNVGAELDRLQRLGVNTVFLQAFSDPDGDGAADQAYFPNRHLPVRADLFNRVAWQIRTRTQVRRLYAWMPLLAFHLPDSDPAAHDLVVTRQPASRDHLIMGYTRLSPFSPRARQAIREIYEDLAHAAPFDGVLFHDDVTLSDYEDDSSWAHATYREWGLPDDIAAIHASDDLLGRWTILKINYLDNFANDMAKVLRRQTPWLTTARNLYAQVALNPRAEVWYAQSLDNSLANYDFTVIMAMPYMEGAADPQAFYRTLVEQVKDKPEGLRKTVFELQAQDWRHQQPVPDRELANTVLLLYGLGAQHVAYYPDDPFRNHPDPLVLKPALETKPNTPTVPLNP